MTAEPMTLRKLVALLGDEFLDAPLMIHISDGNRNGEAVTFPTSLWEMPRREAIPQTGEPARLQFNVSLAKTRLVKVRSK